MSNTRHTRPPVTGTAPAGEQEDNNGAETSGTITEPAAGPAEGVAGEEAGGGPGDRSFSFMGEDFRFADRFAHFAILRLQRFADTADPRAMTAVYDVLETSVHPDDWIRFCDVALAARADDDELAEVLHAAARQLGIDVTRREQAQRRAIPQDRKQPQRRQPRRK